MTRTQRILYIVGLFFIGYGLGNLLSNPVRQLLGYPVVCHSWTVDSDESPDNAVMACYTEAGSCEIVCVSLDKALKRLCGVSI